jgi:hypothetical protein
MAVCNLHTRDRILSAAARCVESGEPNNDAWFATSQIYFSAIASYQALYLLSAESPDRFASVQPESWSKWVPIILRYPNAQSHDSQVRLGILGAVKTYASKEVFLRLQQMVDADNERAGYLFAGRELDFFWGPGLASALLAKSAEPHLKPPVVGALWQHLLKRRTTGAREIVSSFIKLPPPDSDRSRDLMIIATEALITGQDDAGWPAVWPNFSRFAAVQ